jgi:ubiquinone/menaquinone biosynthesis C-methylase UbiE
MEQHQLAAVQFGNTAQNYLLSTVHSKGADLEALAALASALHPRRALDLGCGAGHAAFALAAGGAPEVMACDLSGDMLDVVASAARERGHDGVSVIQGAAESLPFPDAHFGLVVTRFSGHHWMDADAAAREIARVLEPGGSVIVIDTVAPETALFDTVLQTLELLRDLSHVRNRRVSEWRDLLQRAGLVESETRSWKLHMAFESWVARIGTPVERIAALRAVTPALPAEARNYFAVEADGSFTLDAVWIAARRPRQD